MGTCPIKKKDEKYEDLVPYKNMIDENAYESINSAVLVNEDKYDSVEALMKSKE